jgi:hypothetical protein
MCLAIWNILRIFEYLLQIVLIRYIIPVLVSYTKKNLATLEPVFTSAAAANELDGAKL